MNIDNNYITTICAADTLHLSSDHIRRLCAKGQLQGAQKLGRDWLIPRESVLHYTRRKPGPKKRDRISNREILENALKEMNEGR